MATNRNFGATPLLATTPAASKHPTFWAQLETFAERWLLLWNAMKELPAPALSVTDGGGGRRSVSNSVSEARADYGRASRPFE